MMLIRNGNRFELFLHKVKYKQHGKEIEQWALPNKQWWTGFADEWDHTEIIEFVELAPTTEQLARFENIKNFPNDFHDEYTEYVLTGQFKLDNVPLVHPFRLLQQTKENVDHQLNYMIDIDFRVTMIELGL